MPWHEVFPNKRYANMAKQPAAPVTQPEDSGASVGGTPTEAKALLTMSDDTLSADVSIEGIAQSLITEEPAPQQHVIDSVRAEQSQNVDALGTVFDSTVHDASGKKNAKGTWLLKRGRKSGGTNETSKAPKAGNSNLKIPGQMAPAGPSKEQLARQGGAGAANLFIALSSLMLGEEWLPQTNPSLNIDEKVMLESAFGDYFVATGKSDLSPGWALAAVMVFYAARRFHMPVTRSRLQRVTAWTKTKIQKTYIWISNFRNSRKGVAPVKKDTGEDNE